jgi:endonuclease/exonuclease/phosphatase (EEP) superfamily protein YafD
MSKLLMLAYVYLAGLFLWLLLRLFFGDRWWFLFLLNSLALYLFLPLIGVAVIAVFVRVPKLWIAMTIGLIVFVVEYGAMLFPPLAQPPVRSTELTVMTFNVMGIKRSGEQVVASIRAADADVVALQELSERIAESLWTQLSEEYPYQAFHLSPGTGGMGVISRFPLRELYAELGENWIEYPQVVNVRVDGTEVTLLNVHATNISGCSDLFPTPSRIEQATRKREEEARTLRAFVEEHPEHLIIAGDFNTGDQSTAYTILTEKLVDSWRERGWGLGHTFPGSFFVGDLVPGQHRIIFPGWFIRIDYIFHSRDWHTHSVRTGFWDGVSDHRPVVARLTR